MGMYDTVSTDCPSCGEKGGLYWQTKVSDCTLRYFNLDSVPYDVARGVVGQTEPCVECGKMYSLVGPPPPENVSLSIVED